MKNKVYYGEYAIIHWIHLILSKNIELPGYQRYFVWTVDQVKELIKELKNDSFVPPVTIGLIKKDDIKHNYILDGQQRLTSILLAYLSLFPDNETMQQGAMIDDNDDAIEDSECSLQDWSLREITKLGVDRKTILEKVKTKKYRQEDYDTDEDFFKTKKIGFCYIVPQSDSTQEQQEFYSTIFRNINISGVSLQDMESRRSLYFLDENLTKFFEPELGHYVLGNIGDNTPLDFVRYMSMLSQYALTNTTDKITRGYGKRRIRDYYIEYIYAVTNKNPDNDKKPSTMFKSFEEIFPQRDYQPRIDRLVATLKKMDIPHEYPSIIDMDLYMFGLIYYIMIEDMQITLETEEALKAQIRDAIAQIKVPNSQHVKSPANQANLRYRIAESINIYSNYATSRNS